MKIVANYFSFLLLLLVAGSCSSDDPANVLPTFENFPDSGLLEQELVIAIENAGTEELEVSFDSNVASLLRISEDSISVTVPRTITRYNPTLRIIDLNTNDTLLQKTFTLKKPEITGYNAEEVTFGESFKISGANFDVRPEFVSVLVNDKVANIINVTHNEIELQLPEAITTAELEIKVKAQLQETTSTLPLRLKSPIITDIESEVAWINGEFVVNGQNFNPDAEFGEVFINGIKCYFTSSLNQLSIDMPPGPYEDFKITNVTYTTAGLTHSLNCDVPVGNDRIMVDYSENAVFEHTIFEFNEKAYAFKYELNVLNPSADRDYKLLAFSPTTEKWTETNFSYTGMIADAVFDGNHSVYIYKYNNEGEGFVLTKLNLNTFQETALTLPYHKILGPILFAYQDHLYLLSGLNNIDGNVSVREQKYKYDSSTNSWSELPSSAFADLPLGSGKCKYLFHGNNIFISYGISNKSYKITPSLSVSDYNNVINFDYQNTIIGRQINASNYLYNIVTGTAVPVLQDNMFDYGSMFFTVNNEIYYLQRSWTVYYQNTYYTQRLRKEILNGLL